MPKLATKEDLEAMGKQLLLDRKKINKTLIVCGGTGCKASGSQGVIDAINQELLAQEMDSTVHLRITGCHGFCEQGPIMVIEPGNIFYCYVTPQDAHDIVTKTLQTGEVIERLLYNDPVSGKKIRTESEIPFYAAQDRQLLFQNKEINTLLHRRLHCYWWLLSVIKDHRQLGTRGNYPRNQGIGFEGTGRWRFPNRAKVDGML